MMMPWATKKYKLHSVTDTVLGKKPVCAFFASEEGCRNGANCKFSHGEQSEEARTRNQEVVSSESSDNEAENSPFVSKKELTEGVRESSESYKEEEVHDMDDNENNDSPFETSVSYASLADPKRKRKSSEATLIPKSKSKSSTKKVKVNTPDTNRGDNHTAAESSSGGSTTFRRSLMKMDLPIAPFKLQTKPLNNEPKQPKIPKQKKKDTIEAPALPLPNSTNVGKQWLDVVMKTQSHRKFASDYNFTKYQKQDEVIGHASNIWVKTAPFQRAKSSHPQVIAIDCEMCETQDPVSGKKDHRALCRVSVVDAQTEEVLLDTLVKPSWPVSDHRDWVNGITANDLAQVQFTLRHAQAFMMELCSEETVIVGHAVHNDLAALRMEHYCVADSAALYIASDSESATVALRDIATAILQRTMPQTHDSVNDALVALACAEHFRNNNGNVEAITRTPKPLVEGLGQGNGSQKSYAKQLFVHRIPEKKCSESDLVAMFLEHTSIRPEEVDDILYSQNGQGKTHIHFSSAAHAELAFDTLKGKAEVENSGRLQKKVYLRDGSYIRVRMMMSESKPFENEK